MPITLSSGSIVYTDKADRWNSDRTGVFGDQDFAVSDEIFPLKQFKFNMSPLTGDHTVTMAANASTAGNITLTMPSTSGTLALEGSSGIPDLTFQTTAGTYPVLTSTDTVLSFTTLGTITSTGNDATDSISLDIAAGSVKNVHVASDAAIDFSKLATLTAGRVLIGDASNVVTGVAMTGDITMNSSGVTAIGSGVIVNADINASAAIAYSKLASLATGQALIGNGGVPTATTLSGDVTVSSGGTMSIGLGAVTNPKFRNSSALSVVGRASNSAGSVADIVTSSDGDVLRRSGTTLGFGTIGNASISASGVANIALNKLAAATADRVAVFGSGGYLEASTVTTTNLGSYQGQIDAKGFPDISTYRRVSDSTFVRSIGPLITCGDTMDVALAADTIYYFPVVITSTYTADKIIAEVTVTGMTAFIMGIYNDNDVKPRNKVAATSSIPEGVAVFNETLSASLTPGLYWVAIMGQVAGGNFRGVSKSYVVNTLGIAVAMGANCQVTGYTQSYTWDGTLPASAAVDTEYTGDIPLLHISAY